MKQKIGIIQVRGAGDAIIVLPIAEYYNNLGYEVLFALDEMYCESFQYAAPYCTFVPVPSGAFKPELGINNPYWYEIPLELLKSRGCTGVMSFPYQETHIIAGTQDEQAKNSLIHRLQGEFESNITSLQLFSHLKFDEYKYATAGVPFRNKWMLNIKRNTERELDLYDRVVPQNGKQNVVIHLQGSDMGYKSNALQLDRDAFNIIEITPETGNLFDWLTVLERADQIVVLDSVFSNLIEQLNFTNNKYFIRRSPMYTTPVLRNEWKYVRV